MEHRLHAMSHFLHLHLTVYFVDQLRIFADHFHISGEQSAGGTPFGIRAHASEKVICDEAGYQRGGFGQFHV